MTEHKHHWTWDAYEIHNHDGVFEAVSGMVCECSERMELDRVQDTVNEAESERNALRSENERMRVVIDAAEAWRNARQWDDNYKLQGQFWRALEEFKKSVDSVNATES